MVSVKFSTTYIASFFTAFGSATDATELLVPLIFFPADAAKLARGERERDRELDELRLLSFHAITTVTGCHPTAAATDYMKTRFE